MFILRLIKKVLLLPVMVLIQLARLACKVAIDLSSYVTGPLLFFVVGCDIFCLIKGRMQDVLWCRRWWIPSGNTQKRCIETGSFLALFVGAGASVDPGVPLWEQAIEQIAFKLSLPSKDKPYDSLKIPQHYYSSRGKKEYT